MQYTRGQARRRQFRRRRAVAMSGLIAVTLVVIVSIGSGGGGNHHAKLSTHSSTASRGARTAATLPSIEAGVESWSLTAPISREAVVADGAGLTVLGGLTPDGSSLSGVSAVDPRTGSILAVGSLADVVHDAAAAIVGRRVVVFGGGSPSTVAGVQSIASPATPPSAEGTGSVIGALPQPRSDLAVATISAGTKGHTTTTDYIVGGYDGTHYLSSVLATVDGTHFAPVGTLSVLVRYPAVVASGGMIYAFGGETASAASITTATDDIQMIDPKTHTDAIVGHLPQAIYGAAAFVIDGTIYIAGGQVPQGPTQTQIEAFVPRTHRILHAGLLPQAVAFGGYATVDSGRSNIGYLVGGEVVAQSGADAAGIASGSLQSVISLRPSRYGGPAGTVSSGSPFSGTLLVADRGNDRLIALNAARQVTWTYPSATMPAPPGGFYFPDDAFFFDRGTGIISNQEDNHTIVEIGYPSGKLLWQYGHPGVPGALPGYLDQPDDAYLLKSGIVTVADASNNRILFISPSKTIVGTIGNGVDAHNPPTSIAYPNGDTPLANGDVLVSEINGSWIDEYTQQGKLVWSVHMTSVNYPSDPQQLGPNLYLMTDYDPPAEGRVLEFNRQGYISWRYDSTSGDAMLKKPSLAERLPDGLIMVNDDYRDRVVVIDPATNSIVWQFGLTDSPGTSPGLISIPDGFDLLEANGSTPTHPQTG
jgi:outer membrane protein assembly factor BamB